MEKIRIALVQMNSVTGDLEGNSHKIIDRINNAKKQNADLIIFPEMALTGYCISDLIEDNSFVEKNIEFLNKIAEETKGTAVIVGFVDSDMGKKNNDGRLRKYNSAALLQDSKISGVIHKTLLPSYRYFDDKRYFTPGEERKPLIMNLNGKKISLGISICEDMWDEDYEIKPIKELAHKGADILININASPFFPGKFRERKEVILRHIGEISLPFVYLNSVGSADNGKNIIPFDGQSLVYDKNGNLICLGKQFEEETIFFDLENNKKIDEPVFNREKEIFEVLVMSLRNYANQTGFGKAIVPLSGGIDSALGLVITSEAFGNENVIAYNLPSKFNTSTTREIAKKLAHNLDVEYRVIPIHEIDSKVKEVFTENVHEIEKNISKENLHARIRGILMMLESNDTGAMLISNGNKTEIALGYSTLYGDMCGGISVIGDLSKMDVYKLCNFFNEKKGKEIIPNEVFFIKPSAELSEEQYDPFDYEVVSPLVELFVEERCSPSDIVEKFKNKELGDRFNTEVYKKYRIEAFEKLVYDTYKLLRKSVYKRLQGPPIIVVTGRSFGFDLRETLINRWEGK
jgi:NAD+ synthase (glutamine-hydrolysing)